MSTIFDKRLVTKDEDVPDNYRDLIIKNFPYDQPYPGQIGIIYDVLDAYVSNKPFVVLQAGTGTGKSVIGVTVGRILSQFESSTKIITKTRLLQKQYDDSLGKQVPDLALLWGKVHYSDVDEGYEGKVYKCGKSCPGMTQPHEKSECPWEHAKAKYLGSKIGVTNNAMYINAPFFRTRGVLIVDECHNIVDDLIDISSFNFSCSKILEWIHQYNLSDPTGEDSAFYPIKSVKYLKACMEYEMKIPEGVIGFKSIIEHMTRVSTHVRACVLPAFNDLVEDYEKLAEQYPTDNNLKEYENAASRLNGLLKLCANVENVTMENSCIESVYHYAEDDETVIGYTIQSTPYDPSKTASEVLKSNFLVLMSATTGDYGVLTSALKLDPKMGKFIDAPTTFPVENRKVHILNVARINHSNITSLLSPSGEITQKIRNMMITHSNERGLIHTVSYRNASMILDSMWTVAPELAERLVKVPGGTQITHDYIRSLPEDAVIVSPSAVEGVDLKDELARFQVIMKIPFAYLGDNYIASKSDINPDWYRDQAARSVLQMAGRIVRSTTDYGTTYILDKNYDKLSSFIPMWFKVAEVYPDE